MNTDAGPGTALSLRPLALPRSVLLQLHRSFPARYPHLLESTVTSGAGRFDILFAFPGETLTLADEGLTGPDGNTWKQTDFLHTFDTLWASNLNLQAWHDELPFLGGWFLYLGYELAQQIEPSLNLPRCREPCFVARATRVPAACIYDHRHNAVMLVAEPGAGKLLPQIEKDMAMLPAVQPDAETVPALDLQEEDPELFLNNVEKILAYIRDGDVFQVNLSRAWRGKLRRDPSPAALYDRIRHCNPGPFSGLATWEDFAVICSSPERLVAVRNGIIETRPIAGTRPRGKDRSEDAVLSRELLCHPKERAEHIMLIDLERNDLGRVCKTGSIEVNELMALESYAEVHHIVSNIRGRLRDEVTPGEVIRAVFPGGTITGCPKVRCMEIIAELEKTVRGPYTGSFGYVNHNGSMDLNILIRTLVVEGNRIILRAGAGIVADSQPDRELEETRAKARALLRVPGNPGLPRE